MYEYPMLGAAIVWFWGKVGKNWIKASSSNFSHNREK